MTVTPQALIKRINRKLQPAGEALRVTGQNSRWWSSLGDYYIVDVNRNWIVGQFIDIEELGRELGVLRPHESVLACEA